MNKDGISFKKLDYRGDNRGEMYNIPHEDISFLKEVKNIHFGTINPNNIRGNHSHIFHKELIIINFSDKWEFAYSLKNEDEVLKETFHGNGSILIKINEDVFHAIKNTGEKELIIIAITDKEFSIDNNDTVFKKLL